MGQHKDFDLLKAAFIQLYPEIKEEEWEYIAAVGVHQTVKSKSVIIEEGAYQKEIHYLTSGLVRGFYINEIGEEMTIRFVNNEGWITHYAALLSGVPSKYIFQTLETSSYISLPFSAIQQAYSQYKGLEKFGRLIAESILITQQARIESFQFLTAEQRYLEFIEQYPALYNRVSLSHLSTYLGIQRQSLTRIRKKLASN